MPTAFSLLLCVLACFLAHAHAAVQSTVGVDTQAVEDFFTPSSPRHTTNWAVIACTSRFWFNYRHISNALGIYRTVKRLGIPDSQIILMLADDVACNPRNVFPATVMDTASHRMNIYGNDIEVDYRGYEVSVESFIRVLTGRHVPYVPRSKRLDTDDGSNILIFMTGHGGDRFLKFQDAEEISSQDLGDVFHQMWQRKRYNEILFMIDTCQANTLYENFYSPNIIAIGSSRRLENSYSHAADGEVGVAIVDRFTAATLEFCEARITPHSNATLMDMFHSYDPDTLHSHPEWRVIDFHRPVSKVLVTDFFASVVRPRVVDTSVVPPIGPILETDIAPQETGYDSSEAPADQHQHQQSSFIDEIKAAFQRPAEPMKATPEFYVTLASFVGLVGVFSLLG